MRKVLRLRNARLSQAQGAYMVTSGTHVDGVYCFDFGQAETSNGAESGAAAL